MRVKSFARWHLGCPVTIFNACYAHAIEALSIKSSQQLVEVWQWQCDCVSIVRDVLIYVHQKRLRFLLERVIISREAMNKTLKRFRCQIPVKFLKLETVNLCESSAIPFHCTTPQSRADARCWRDVQ